MTEGFTGTVTRRSSLDGRTHNGRGYIEETTWVEPPLDNRWSDLDKLRWWAAVVSHDTGLSVTVQTDIRMRVIRSWDTYQVDIGHTSMASTGTFDHTWGYLAGVLAGAQAAHPKERARTEARISELRSLIDGWKKSAKGRIARAKKNGQKGRLMDARANLSAASVYESVAMQAEVILDG